jgi:hypothetical protein
MDPGGALRGLQRPAEEMSGKPETRVAASVVYAKLAEIFGPNPRPVVTPPATGTIQAQFEAFHALNPNIYAGLCVLARDLKSQGCQKLGISLLVEHLRWYHLREMAPFDPSSKFGINNNYRSRYARLIHEQEPDLDGVFELRELKSL